MYFCICKAVQEYDQGRIKKIKDEPAPKKLPLLSTNFRDVFKYLMMRKKWRRMVRNALGNQAKPYVPSFEE